MLRKFKKLFLLEMFNVGLFDKCGRHEYNFVACYLGYLFRENARD
jgi:hypothetical protein